MEWSKATKYNSFNSDKGLVYYPQYKQISDWMAGKGDLGPPVECSLDPIMSCNNACYYCNSQRYLREERVDESPLTLLEIEQLTNYLSVWGVLGVCYGGGGEPTLHPQLAHAMILAQKAGMKTCLVTNGTRLKDIALQWAIMESRWVGVSIDAADTDTYKRIRGVDLFDTVIKGVGQLVTRKHRSDSRVAVAVKVLVLPENYNRLYDICKLARELGVDDFHVRPVDLERKDFKLAGRCSLDMNVVHEQFAKCHTLETPDFHVYTVMHKYDANFHVKHEFSACLVSPLVLQACTDRNAYVCVDHRLEERFKLGSWLDIDKWWGSKSHKELLKSIDPTKECSRCTWSEYQRQYEEVVLQDRMCVAFP